MSSMRLSTTLTCSCKSSQSRSHRVITCRHYSAAPSLLISDHVQAPHCGHIKILKLNRPEAKNAISRKLLSDLKHELSHLKFGPRQTRALIITSTVPRAFCAGADLKERRTFTLDDTREFLTNLRGTFSQLASLPIPTISAINGAALGGGLELALCTTFRVAASTAVLGLPETRLGIIPGAGGTFRLPALIGLQRARDMILRGYQVSPAEASQIGLIDKSCEVNSGSTAEEAVFAGALEVAKEICTGGPIAILQALKAVNSWQHGEKAENAAYEGLLGSRDRLEALNAFSEKRKPTFQGD